MPIHLLSDIQSIWCMPLFGQNKTAATFLFELGWNSIRFLSSAHHCWFLFCFRLAFIIWCADCRLAHILTSTNLDSHPDTFFSVIQFSNDVDGVLLIYVAFFSKRILSSKALNFIKKRLKFVNFENVCFCADNAFLSDQWTHVVRGRYLKYNFVAVYVFAWIQFTHK